MNASIQKARVANAGAARRLSIGQFAFAAVLYIVLAILFTWPAAIRPYTTVVGDADALGGIWWVWARLNGFIDVFHCTKLIAWPEGSCGPMPTQPIAEYSLLFFSWLTNETLGHTLYIGISLFATALTAFLLLIQRGIAWPFAAWAGALIGFNAPTLVQILGGHLAYALAVPVLLFLDQLERLWAIGESERDSRSANAFNSKLSNLVRSGLRSGIWLGLTFATSIYSGYFLSVLVAIIGVAAAIRAASTIAMRQDQDNGTRIEIGLLLTATAPYFITLVIAGAISFACNALLVAHALGALPSQLSQSGGFFSRDFSDLIAYSARPLDYMRPFSWHPLWEEIFRASAKLPKLTGNAYEVSLFPGLIALLFSAVGVALFRIAPRTHLHALFVRVLIFVCIMFFMSLKPMWAPLDFVEVPTLSAFLYPLAPMFRVYARCGIFVAIGLGILAAIGATWLIGYVQIKRGDFRLFFQAKILIFGTICAAGILELFPASIGRGNSTISGARSPTTTAIAALPEGAIIANYPMFAPIDLAHYRYLFWQRQHKKRMINGQYEAGSNFEVPKGIADPSNPTTQAYLRELGVTHIVIHPELYASGAMPKELLKIFDASAMAADLPRVRNLSSKSGAENIYSLISSEE